MQSWNAPVMILLPGVAGPLSLYDSLSREKRTLTRAGGSATLYVCGITPYDATHLGHASTYLAFDTLVRVWRDQGLTVSYAQNITDIDEPLLERAERDAIDWRELASREIELFRTDMAALGVIPPDHFVGAVEAMDLIGGAAAALVDAGDAYPVEADGVRDYYFAVGRDEAFGELSQLDRPAMVTRFGENGGDPERSGKRDPLDAVVWRGQRPDEPSWPSPLGAGRPGWHVECAAIALDCLGPTIDVQGGGADLVFPHHEYSASTAKALSGAASFAAVYMHAGMMRLDGEKMSKSRGNLVLVSALREQGVDPRVLRLALLSEHYSQDRDWSSDLLIRADVRLRTWHAATHRVSGPPARGVLEAVRAALADDLDVPSAFQALDAWCGQSGHDEVSPRLVREIVMTLLGVNLRRDPVPLPDLAQAPTRHRAAPVAPAPSAAAPDPASASPVAAPGPLPAQPLGPFSSAPPQSAQPPRDRVGAVAAGRPEEHEHRVPLWTEEARRAAAPDAPHGSSDLDDLDDFDDDFYLDEDLALSRSLSRFLVEAVLALAILAVGLAVIFLLD